MPTERFMRLSEEKKKAIREAAIKEFIRVPYDKASINKIIQSAEISRGSFYTYFEDKVDILSFLLQDVREDSNALALKVLNETGGDIWLMLQELLNQSIRYCSSHDMFRLLKHTLLSPEAEALIHRECKGKGKTLYAWMYDHVDLSHFRHQDRETLEDTLAVGMGILGDSIGRFYKEGTRVEQVKETFQRRLNLLKEGVCKESETIG